jgi:putative nucleotidyltransferase with HDIG domain
MKQKNQIPTREECLKMMGQRGVLAHIVDHCLEVAKVAGFLAVELNKKGQRIDLRLVEAASLLHDLTKTEGLRTRENHAKTGSQLLKGMGYERIGEVVSQHIHLAERIDPSLVSEEEVVNYADKRVQHDRIVSLRERFVDLKERYAKSGGSFELLNNLEKASFELEGKIFSILEIDPAALQSLQ